MVRVCLVLLLCFAALVAQGLAAPTFPYAALSVSTVKAGSFPTIYVPLRLNPGLAVGNVIRVSGLTDYTNDDDIDCWLTDSLANTWTLVTESAPFENGSFSVQVAAMPSAIADWTMMLSCSGFITPSTVIGASQATVSLYSADDASAIELFSSVVSTPATAMPTYSAALSFSNAIVGAATSVTINWTLMHGTSAQLLPATTALRIALPAGFSAPDIPGLSCSPDVPSPGPALSASSLTNGALVLTLDEDFTPTTAGVFWTCSGLVAPRAASFDFATTANSGVYASAADDTPVSSVEVVAAAIKTADFRGNVLGPRNIMSNAAYPGTKLYSSLPSISKTDTVRLALVFVTTPAPVCTLNGVSLTATFDSASQMTIFQPAQDLTADINDSSYTFACTSGYSGVRPAASQNIAAWIVTAQGDFLASSSVDPANALAAPLYNAMGVTLAVSPTFLTAGSVVAVSLQWSVRPRVLSTDVIQVVIPNPPYASFDASKCTLSLGSDTTGITGTLVAGMLQFAPTQQFEADPTARCSVTCTDVQTLGYVVNGGNAQVQINSIAAVNILSATATTGNIYPGSLGTEYALAGTGTALAGSNTLLRVKIGPTKTAIPAGGGFSLALPVGYSIETSSLASCTLNGQTAVSPALVGSRYVFGFSAAVPVDTIIDLRCNGGFVLPSISTASQTIQVTTTVDLTVGSKYMDSASVALPQVFTADDMSQRGTLHYMVYFVMTRSTVLTSSERANVLSSLKTTSGLGSTAGLTFGFARMSLWDDSAPHIVTASSPLARAQARSTFEQSDFPKLRTLDLNTLGFDVYVTAADNTNSAAIIDIVTAFKSNGAAITTALSTLLGGAVTLDGTQTYSTNALCSDQEKNGSETDVDCGGDCFACDAGKACATDDDCLSYSCSGTTNTCMRTSDGKTSGASLVTAPASTLAALAIVAVLCMLQLVLA